MTTSSVKSKDKSSEQRFGQLNATNCKSYLNNIFTAWCYAFFAVARCPSVCPSVCLSHSCILSRVPIDVL